MEVYLFLPQKHGDFTLRTQRTNPRWRRYATKNPQRVVSVPCQNYC